MIPKNIRKEHILKAIQDIDKKGIPKGRESKKFNLLYNWKFYPPKYVISLANKYVNGEELNSEVFGGGVETNEFLRKFGFKISEGNLRTARIILDIGVSMRELKKGGNAWTELRRVISDTFVKNPSRYQHRIKKLLERCIQENTNVVIFPACSMIYRNKKEKEVYLNISREIPWLASGFLDIDNETNPDYFDENAEVLNFGKSIENFDHRIVLWIQMDSFSSMIAISSTITEIRNNEPKKSKNLPPDEESHVFVFDLGHHQYNGRYTRTMKSVLTSMETKSGKKKAIILAYWKYLNANPYYFWYEPYSSWIKFKRIQMEFENDRKVDFLDIFDIKL